MASNEPTGDNRRIGAVKKRTQLKTKMMGEAHWTKRSKDITHMSIGSYSVSSSLWTDKMLVQQQPMDGYDVYSQMGPRVSNGCRIRNSNKKGMPEYRKTLWGTTTKGARLSGFRHCHESTG